MQILDVISAKLNLARRVLIDFIEHYDRMEDAERLEKSNTIMDEINSYLQIKENLLFPIMRRDADQHTDLLERASSVHREINSVAEHAIMVHVDEPGNDYYNRMVRLLEVLDISKKVDEEAIFPWANAYLTEQDQYQIATHLKNQMTHESLSSSGLTIY